MGDIYSFDIESDIAELSWRWQVGLRCIVDSGKDKFTPVFLEVVFPQTRGFRLLDEGDLIRYWESSAFNERYHVYEMEEGGWLTGETLDPGMLSVSSSVGMREWFVITTNSCLTVIGDKPLLRELKVDNT